MSQPKPTRIPAPIYAAAGAGDLAYRQLRKLPAVATELRGKVATVAARLGEEAAARLRTANAAFASQREVIGAEYDADKLRKLARRNVAAVVTGAQATQERAAATYHRLVAHGERVVAARAERAADPADAEVAAIEPSTEPTAVK